MKVQSGTPVRLTRPTSHKESGIPEHHLDMVPVGATGFVVADYPDNPNTRTWTRVKFPPLADVWWWPDSALVLATPTDDDDQVPL